MKRLWLLVILLGLTMATPQVGAVSLVWNASAGTNIAGYNVYVGGTSRTYTNKIIVGAVTNYVLLGMKTNATYFLAVTAYDLWGLESDYSAEISYTVPALPVTTNNYLTVFVKVFKGTNVTKPFLLFTNVAIFQATNAPTLFFSGQLVITNSVR